ncbi:MAG: DNA N-6-adenine-methyltransferase [Pseudomonadota bacterium]
MNRDGGLTNDDWATPDWLYQKLNSEFNFDFDPCPLKAKFDGLQVEWGKSDFVNPPYNRVDKPKFISKAYQEYQKGKTVVLLIPAATGTKQFHELILPNAEVRFLKGRVSFKGTNSKGIYTEKNKGNHDSMIVIFRGDK